MYVVLTCGGPMMGYGVNKKVSKNNMTRVGIIKPAENSMKTAVILNNVNAVRVFSGIMGLVDAAKISHKAMTGMALRNSESMPIVALKPLKIERMLPAENKMMPARNKLLLPML